MMREVLAGMIAALLLALAWQGINVTPYLLIGGIVLMLMYFTDLKGLSKSFTPVNAAKSSNLARFEQIGGQNTAKKELQEALDFICFPKRTSQMGIRPLKGILLSGPPGTGKTLLAKAAAAYTQSAFIASSGSEFIEMYAGVGAQRVRQLFDRARSTALREKKHSAVIFIDEIEIIGGKRGANSSHHEYDQTLNQLLVEMDGLQAQSNIRTLVIGATNRADMLDPALLRPGRFDRAVKVDLPDLSGRIEILKLHLGNKPLDANVSIENIARETFGFSGAHLESLANEAAILAMREGRDKIAQSHLSEAVDKVIMGEKLEKKPAKEELWRVAVHEAGHALTSETLRPGSVSSVTIAPRGSSLGYVRQSPETDSYLYTLKYLEDQIAILLSGSIAEEQLLKSRSTGAAGDFSQAVDIAKKIIASGMSTLSVVSLDNLPERILHRVISEIMAKQENRIRMFFREKETALRSIAEFLIENERVSGEYLREITSSEQQTA
jgi:vesicle-fusing ATPase